MEEWEIIVDPTQKNIGPWKIAVQQAERTTKLMWKKPDLCLWCETEAMGLSLGDGKWDNVRKKKKTKNQMTCFLIQCVWAAGENYYYVLDRYIGTFVGTDRCKTK